MDDEQKEYANFWNHIRLKTLFQTIKKEIGNSMQTNPKLRQLIGWFGCFALYGLIPLYLVSKVLTFLYPLIIVAVVSMDETEMQWDEVPMFQVTMLIIYALMVCVVVGIGIPSLRLLYYLWHIAPGDDNVILVRMDMLLAQEYY